MIFVLLGAAAIFIWAKLSPKKPTEKTELLESALPEPRNILDTLKAGGAKVAGIVGGGAGVAKVAGGAATVAGGGTVLGGTAIAVSALPAATVLPAGLSAMAPTTLTSAAYGTTPAIVGTGSGSSSIGAGVGGSSGIGAAIGGAAMLAAPLVVVPVIAKFLDKIFGIGKSGLYDNPELLAEQLQITKEKEAMIAASVPGGATPTWDPKTGFYEGDPG